LLRIIGYEGGMAGTGARKLAALIRQLYERIAALENQIHTNPALAVVEKR